MVVGPGEYNARHPKGVPFFTVEKELYQELGTFFGDE
jgi:hypothetical protein